MLSQLLIYSPLVSFGRHSSTEQSNTLDTYIWVGCGVNLRTNTQKKSAKEIELYTQDMLTVLCSIVNMMGRPIWPLMSTRTLTVIMNQIFIQAPKLMTQMAMGMIWNHKSSCTNCVGATKKSIYIYLKYIMLMSIIRRSSKGRNTSTNSPVLFYPHIVHFIITRP